mmetsp:Transcript_12612/g.41918  ORF Transcript_12612/g.41918 Transcript_12612/m.41918 type:complete len:273 (-) Transcript_12612:465-1283(-)
MRSANFIRKHRGSLTRLHSMRRRLASSATSTPWKFSFVSAIFSALGDDARFKASRSNEPDAVVPVPSSGKELFAISALRRCDLLKICGSFPSVDTSVTNVATFSPNVSWTSTMSHSVSSTTSCKTHATIASTYFFLAHAPVLATGNMAAKISAASTQCVTYGSPVRRYWPWCHLSAKVTAVRTLGCVKMGNAPQSTPHTRFGDGFVCASASSSSGKTSFRNPRSHSCHAVSTPTDVVNAVANNTAGTLKCAPIDSYCASPGNKCVFMCALIS